MLISQLHCEKKSKVYFLKEKNSKYFAGTCLYLSKTRSELDIYDCSRRFRCGCPEKQYLSSSIYQCKHGILSLYQSNSFFSQDNVNIFNSFGTVETFLLYMLFLFNQDSILLNIDKMEACGRNYIKLLINLKNINSFNASVCSTEIRIFANQTQIE